MCLAIPGKVIEINTRTKPLMGKVSFGGNIKDICLEWVPDVTAGQYVIVHVGFALNTMDEQEALETIRLIEEIERRHPDSFSK